MIVFSLLLILVAVVLLVLGLAGGSSMVLISSIGASLLAAVALVIGARQAAVIGRAATARADSPRPGPAYAGPAGSPPDDRPTVVSSPVMAAAGPAPAHDRLAGDRPLDDPRAGDRSAREQGPGGWPTGDPVTGALPSEDRPSSGGLSGDPVEADPAAFADDPPPQDEGLASMGAAEARGANRADAESALAADAAYRAANQDDPDSQSAGIPADVGPQSDGVGVGLAAEFGVPDEDDPADEPLPQAARPADAVQVARMSSEVLVVDGRPRYHVAHCPFLAGRLTEPLPAAEAVELGFSPCGVCRPVDRLVARAAHR